MPTKLQKVSRAHVPVNGKSVVTLLLKDQELPSA